MDHRSLALFIAAIVLAPPHTVAQTTTSKQSKPAQPWTPPRTTDGRPDLQGIWSNAALTPFERPTELEGKEFFTEAEAAEFTRAFLDRANRDRRGATPQEDVEGSYNEVWIDRGTKIFPNFRTSIVVDPANGRVPPLTTTAREAAAARAAVQQRRPEGPEDLELWTRCILARTSGPPMIPGAYNNNYQFVQTRDTIAIDSEMIHDVRIIPLDRRPHISSDIRLWMGSSVGHWEGETLVVDTTNFTDKTPFHGSDRNLHVIERFTLTGPDTIRYRFTIDDATAFTRMWTGETIMSRARGPLYEYACHETNYSLRDILAGARAEEKHGRLEGRARPK
ncbi:MAG TPA: hypothetical protein VK789_25875 [Bryobacteraceae bacterium]|jgi:hypothetical protein|nr:hypothetical protein [Bryobacteraceae bacterium]